jgi:amidophosphoribosyltransferase
VLLNVLAHELEMASRGVPCSPTMCSRPCGGAQAHPGSYAVIALIAGYGLLAFRDPSASVRWHGAQRRWHLMVASESVALEGTGHQFERDVAPGEATVHHARRPVHARNVRSSPAASLHVRVCVPGTSRLGAGRHLGLPGAPEHGRDAGQARDLHRAAQRNRRGHPIPESSRPSAMQLAQLLGKPYREGFVKNRYVGRTFIMPGQAVRKKSVRQKLNAIGSEFKGRNVLLVDDSIVRGTTSRRSCRWRAAGRARCTWPVPPPVRYPNVYGIDMPTAASWWPTAARSRKCARSSAATR